MPGSKRAPGASRATPAPTIVERQLEDLKDNPKLSPSQRAEMAQKRAVIQKGATRPSLVDRRARRTAQRKERMASMTPEERDAVRERRRMRRQRKHGGNTPPAEAPAPVEDEELPADDIPEDEPFVDTGTP